MIKRLISDFKLDYGVSVLDFGMVRKVDEAEDAVELVIGFKSCRDYLHDVIRCQLHGGVDWYSKYDSKRHKPVDLDVFRLVLRIKQEDEGRIPALRKAINILEEVAGLDTKLTITKVEAELKPNETAYLMEGDRFWISTPYTMSILSLVSRWLIARVDKIPTDFNDYDYDKLISFFKGAKIKSSSNDSTSYMPSMLIGLTPILKNHKTIFKLPVEEAYPNFKKYSRDDFHSKGGIHELCNFRTGMIEIENPLKKEIAKYGCKTAAEAVW